MALRALPATTGLGARLEEWQWRNIRVAVGEQNAGGAPNIPPWPEEVGGP